MEELSNKLATQIMGIRESLKGTEAVESVKTTAQLILPSKKDSKTAKHTKIKQNQRKWHAKYY